MARPRNKETDELAKKLDVSKRHAERLKEQGVTVNDADNSRAAKLKKTLVEIGILEAKLAKFNRDVIALSEAKSYGASIALVVEEHWDEIMVNWATEHSGKTELYLKQSYDKASIAFKNRLRETVENI